MAVFWLVIVALSLPYARSQETDTPHVYAHPDSAALLSLGGCKISEHEGNLDTSCPISRYEERFQALQLEVDMLKAKLWDALNHINLVPPAAPLPTMPPPPPGPPNGPYLKSYSANGWGGITEVKVKGISVSGGTTLYAPIVHIPGKSCGASGNGWSGVHGGNANSNGINTCDAMCKALDLEGIRTSGWNPGSSSAVYTDEVAQLAPTCAYKDSTTDAASAWTCPYSSMPQCTNSMQMCYCTGTNSAVPPSEYSF
jgi:hypothetical protein